MFKKLLGIVLLILGIYLLGQNIVITTNVIRPIWGDALAIVSLLSLMLGVVSLVCFQREVGGLGWVFLGIGVVAALFGGRLIIRPTTLWYFLCSFASLIAGLKLLTTRRLRF